VALTLEQVGYSYGEDTHFAQRALSGVDLRIEVGELTLVLGKTGAGKSTLLKVAAGMLAPTEGDVRLEDVRVERMIAGSEGGVGLVFQSPETQLFADTVLDDVAFGPRNQGLGETAAREAARQAIAEVGLDPDTFGPRSPFGLSGGEARRVALAGVLAMRPRYVLLDEPTAGLDASGRAAVRAIIAKMRSQTGIVVVTHDAEEYLPVADSVCILREGAVAFSGSPVALARDPGAFARADIEPPDIVQIQLLAREQGLRIDSVAFEPAAAAAVLLGARMGGTS
jgi:energy-coupling factor transport system ATP-binding protein